MTNEYMTIEEAAAYIRCKESTLANACANRRIDFIKGPGIRLFTRPMLDAWLDKRTRKAKKAKRYTPRHEQSQRPESVR